MTKQYKNLVLLVGFVLVLTLSYKLAIKNTLELKNKHTQLENENGLILKGPQQLNILKQKTVYYDSILGQYKLDKSSIQNNLLKVINKYATKNQLKVVDFIEPHITTTNDLVIKTYNFTLEGPYNTINQFIFLLEQETKFGEIISLSFEKKKNYKTAAYYLQARVLLESFR